MSPSRRSLLELLERYPGTSTLDVASALNWTVGQVRKQLWLCRKVGLLAREGSKFSGGWTLTAKGLARLDYLRARESEADA